MKPHSHCNFCGVPFVSQAWPRKCASCSQVTFRNPAPVVVVLIPIVSRHNSPSAHAVLTVRRGIEPAKGMLALPGGYMDVGETWQEAGAREVREETGIEIAPESLQLFGVEADTRRTSVLIFALALPTTQPTTFLENHEVQSVEFVTKDSPDLAFPTHTEAVRRYFSQQG